MDPAGDARVGTGSSSETRTERNSVVDGAQAAAIAEEVRAEQVRTLYRQSAPVLLANVVNAVILSLVLWTRVRHDHLIAWTTVMAVMAFVRVRMRQRYWASDWTATEQETWGARF